MKKCVLSLIIGLTFVATMASAETAATLQKKAKQVNAGAKDIRATMVITDSAKKGVKDINPALLDALNVKQVDLFYSRPNKYRAEAMAKGMQITWVLNGDRQLISAPGLMIRKVENIGDKPGKWRTSLDMGFVSDQLWSDFKVYLLTQKKTECKLKLVPKGEKAKRHEIIWVEPSTMKLLKRERHGGEGDLKVRYVYSDFKKVGKLPVAQQAKIYDPQGDFAGTVEYRNMKGNTGVSPSLFSLTAR
jgi:outer membrane lipoprotein-sorting protein